MKFASRLILPTVLGLALTGVFASAAQASGIDSPTGTNAAIPLQSGGALVATLQPNGILQFNPNNTASCTGMEGAIRYNQTTKVFEGCNGVVWGNIFGGGVFGGAYTLNWDYISMGYWGFATAAVCATVNPTTGTCGCPSWAPNDQQFSSWEDQTYTYLVINYILHYCTSPSVATGP